MSKPLVDARARERIHASLDRNVLVEAGAGSGKTHEMAARMAAGVAGGVYVVEHMAAVTFTRKAAAELRGRFQLALETELKKAASDPARASRIREALSKLERFFAGTIHSFCAHLLRERPVEAGVSPGFTELDEVEDQRLRRQSWRDYRTQAKAAGDPLMLALLDAGVKPSDLDEAFDRVCLFEEVEFPAGDAKPPDARSAWKAMEVFWAELKKKLPATIAPDTTCKTQQAARRFIGQLRVAAARRGQARALVSLLETWDFEPGITQNRWADDAATKEGCVTRSRPCTSAFRTDVVAPFLQQWRQYVYGLSVRLLTQARVHARDERRRLNTLNYGDLLQMAAQVLRENAGVREALGSKYRWLFVDEFQDTDPVQAEIILLLAGAGSREAEAVGRQSGVGAPSVADWRTIPLRPGALFVVGDPKQSIYRFRRADIDIYNEVRARLEQSADGEVVALTSNFRSVPALCGWANTVFETQFPGVATTQSPAFAPLDAAHDPPRKGLSSGVVTLTTPETVASADVPAEEAAQIARYIRSEVGSGRRQFGDFLILTRKRKDVETYASALEELRVPVEVSGAGAFGSSVEVQQLALLLRALSDPQDGVSLVGVLRGALFGVSDQDLFAYRQAGGWFSLFAAAPESADPRAQRVSDAIASLRQMHRWTQVLPVGAAVERMLEHTGYLALAATTPDGVEAGDLLHAVDRVRSIVESGFTLADAAAALEPEADESSEVESLPLEPGRTDVVRLMNLHKAKGLEAPVVFLASPAGAVMKRADIRIVRQGVQASGYFRITRAVGEHGHKVVAEPVGWTTHEQLELQYLQAEEIRLLYVAGTRAKELLVVGRWAKPNGSKRSWGMFEPFLVGMPELNVPGSVKLPAAESVDLSVKAAEKSAARAAAAHEEARRVSWAAGSVTGEKRLVTRQPVTAAIDDPTAVVSADTPSRRADAGAAWGTLVHGLLEHAMRHKQATRDDLRRLAMWLTVDEPGLRPVIDEAIATVQSVTTREFWEHAKASPECHEEVPFAITAAGEKGTAPKVLHGTIDAVFTDGASWRVVDYKTDADGAAVSLTDRYKEQLEAYAAAWRRFVDNAVTTDIVDARRRKG